MASCLGSLALLGIFQLLLVRLVPRDTGLDDLRSRREILNRILEELCREAYHIFR